MKVNSKKMIIQMAVKGLTLSKFSTASGVSRATLSAAKNGKSCSINTIAKIAKTLDLSVEELIETEV